MRPRVAAIAVLACSLTVFGTALVVYVLRSGYAAGADCSSHLAEILEVARALRAGRTDFWFDQTNLGYPLFLTYPPGPLLVMGGATAALQGLVAPAVLFRLSVALLWGLVPLTWYLGGRWLGMNRVASVVLGALAVGVHDFSGFGMGLASIATWGLYSQSFGIVLLPLVVGSQYRCLVTRESGPLGAGLWFAALLVCHSYLALLALVAGGLWMFAPAAGPLRQRLWRLFGLVVTGCATNAFWLVPYFQYRKYQNGFPWQNELKNGWGLGTSLLMLVRGKLFDDGRLPWLSLLVAGGLVLAVRRFGQPRYRFALLLFGTSFLFYLGPSTWGSLYRRLPLHGDLEATRYLCGIQLAGLLLAAEAASELRHALPARLMIVGAASLLCCYLADRAHFIGARLRTFAPSAEYSHVVELLRGRKNGRLLAHPDLDTGGHVYTSLLPALSEHPQLAAMGRGYHDTSSVYYVAGFDFTPEAFRLFNVRQVLSRRSRGIGLLRTIWQGQEHRLEEAVDDYGYFEFIHVPFALDVDLRADRASIDRIARESYRHGALPELRERAATRPTEVPMADAAPIRSQVRNESSAPNTYVASVDVQDESERLLLKVSYHPLWHVTIDGREAPALHVAPNYLAVAVPRGNHEVAFRFENPRGQKILFLLTLSGLAIGILFARQASVTHVKLRGVPALFVVIVVVLGSSVRSPAQATVLGAQDLRQLAGRSELIVLARVESTVSRWEAGRIVTEASVRVEESVKGRPPKHLQVVESGGRVGDIAMRVLGGAEFHDGDRSILFLARAEGELRVVGLAHGKLDLDRADAALVGAAPAPAHTYVRRKTSSGTPLAWRRQCPELLVDGIDNPALPGDRLRSALERSASAWNDPTRSCDNPQLAISRKRSEGRSVAFDGVNVVLWRLPGFCDDPQNARDDVCTSPAATAVTTVFYHDHPGDPDDGELLQVDIELNAAHYTFADDGAPDAIDLENTLTHELGHVLGLDHTCYTTAGAVPPVDANGTPVPPCDPVSDLPPEVRDATMFAFESPGEISKRIPTQAETAGICAMYAGRPNVCDSVIVGGCQLVPRRTGLPLGCSIAAAVAFLLQWRRARPSHVDGHRQRTRQGP